jgi:hypothetical protein
MLGLCKEQERLRGLQNLTPTDTVGRAALIAARIVDELMSQFQNSVSFEIGFAVSRISC